MNKKKSPPQKKKTKTKHQNKTQRTHMSPLQTTKQTKPQPIFIEVQRGNIESDILEFWIQALMTWFTVFVKIC